MESCNMTENNSVEVFSKPHGEATAADFVKYSDFVALEEKIKLFEAIAKDAFFAGFELSKFFPSDSDISKKWNEYRDSIGI